VPALFASVSPRRDGVQEGNHRGIAPTAPRPDLPIREQVVKRRMKHGGNAGMATENPIPRSPVERPGRPLLIGATLLVVAASLAAWRDTEAAEQGSKLGTRQKVTLCDDESAVSPQARTGGDKDRKPIEAQVLCSPDSASTESLLPGMNGRLHTTAGQWRGQVWSSATPEGNDTPASAACRWSAACFASTRQPNARERP